jgi:hypothetical protein
MVNLPAPNARFSQQFQPQLLTVNPHAPQRDQPQFTADSRMKATFVLSALAATFLALPAHADTLATPACQRDIAQVQKARHDSLARMRALSDMPQEQKCSVIADQGELERNAREVFSRCLTGRAHDQAIADADDLIAAVRKTYDRVCPPRPGMVRVTMMETRHVSARELPRGLAAAHRCDTDNKMSFMNEPFVGGRIMLAGCAGRTDASAEERQARNISAAALADEQVRVYLTLDASGRGAEALRFPIFAADGNQLVVDTLPQQGTMPTGLDSVVANWAPADPAICRVHAEWHVKARKAELVLWQELADCKAPGPPAFKTIVDRREAKQEAK